MKGTRAAGWNEERDLEEDREIHLAGELGAEEESPYLRRQRTLSVRRKRFSPRARWTALGVAVLALAGTAGYFFASSALNSPRFVLASADDVAVEGNQYVSREEVLGALGLPAAGPIRVGSSVFRLSLGESAKQVEAISWVRSATVTRAYPHRLAIRVVERTPVAFVSLDGYLKLVDGDGIILDKPEKGTFDFPVLTGLDTAADRAERRVRLALYQDFMSQVSGEALRAGWLISEVNLSVAGDLEALLVAGGETIRIHFGESDFSERFHNFLASLRHMSKANAQIDSVDLRYKGQIVVNPQKAEAKAGSKSNTQRADRR